MGLLGQKHMIKHILQLSTLTVIVGFLASDVVPDPEARPTSQDQTTYFEKGQLQKGMTMSDVQRALGREGNIWRVERTHLPQTNDPLAWDVEWEISCIYVTNTTEPDQVVSFGAWGTESANNRPPNSAFRLRDWQSVD